MDPIIFCIISGIALWFIAVSPSGSPYTWEEKAVYSSEDRSKTFFGIADAMAMQWGALAP